MVLPSLHQVTNWPTMQLSRSLDNNVAPHVVDVRYQLLPPDNKVLTRFGVSFVLFILFCLFLFLLFILFLFMLFVFCLFLLVSL